MSKSRKRFDKPGQLSILDYIRRVEVSRAEGGPGPGSLDIDSRIRALLAKAISKSPRSRYHIAADMSELLGRDITRAMLDSWTAESKGGHRFPLAYLPAFCVAVDDYSLPEMICQVLGLYVLPGPDALRAEIQRLEEKKKDTQAEIRKRKLFLSEIEGTK